MNGGKSDASTSTDDVKDRPLCLFYFTHPFGVLSPEPPTVTTAPPGVTRAFLNMEPISPFYWAGSSPGPPSPPGPPGAAAEDSCRSSSPASMQFELGAAMVHRAPVSVLRPPGPLCPPRPPLLPRRDSSALSAALFATDVWFPSVGSSRIDFPRRAPYSRILPPLLLPSPRDQTDDYSSDDIWPRKCLSKFSLPPIELPPPPRVTLVRTEGREDLSGVESVGSVREMKCRRKEEGGVKKAKRRGRGRVGGRGGRRGGDVRRMVGTLMRRALRGGGSGSTLTESHTSQALQHALNTIREAWSEPTSLRDRCSRVLSRMYARNSALEGEHTIERVSARESDGSGAMTRTLLTALQPRPHASPGLMRRRYSVPETIMRRYRLAQQHSDSEECAVPECCGGAGAPPARTPRSAGESPRRAHPARRDRELMRKSALLRRMWTRPPPAPPADSTAPASPDTDAPRAHLFSYESDALSSSLPTAKETPASADLERHSEAPSPPSPCLCPCPGLACTYDVLEVVVSESSSSSPPEGAPPAPAAAAPPRRVPLELDVDEYVSRVLVESLHSLSDRLEGMPAGGGGDRRLSVVEKEIKVRLQHAAVNTIVHLSPTSNHQIIFGNEELGDGERRDRCNNPRAPSPPREDNNNNYEGSPSASPTPTPSPRAAAAGFDAVIQHDNVNRAVLQQIQMLFRDELRRESDLRDDEGGARSHVEISNVDVYLSDGAGSDTISVLTRDAGEWGTGGGVGVGAGNYFSDAGRGGALVPRRCAAPRSASMEVHASSSSGAEGDALGEDTASLVDSLDDPASPRDPPPPLRDSSAAFFVRIRDSAAPERARVAECMPDRIRQKLHRRHRTRELRAECARQSKVRQLRDELQRRRLADAEPERRAPRRERAPPAPPPRDPRDVRARGARPHAEPAPQPAAQGRTPRRIYQKSEIHEGDKCIEILEILEYSHASRSSDSTPTDEGGGVGARARCRRSRIPVPVPSAAEHMRLTGGHAPADVVLRAPAPPAAPRPQPPELRERCNSLRFKRVFDMIPEERAPADAEEAEGARARLSPSPPPRAPPAPASPPHSPRHVTTRSAGTSPPSEARRLRINRTTMTSPPNRSAATSPWRGVPSPREGIVFERVRSRESEPSALGADGRRPAESDPSRRRRGGGARSPAARVVGRRRLQLQRARGRLAAVLAGAALAVGAAPPSTPRAPRLPRARRQLVGDGGGLVSRGAARRRGDAAALPARAPRPRARACARPRRAPTGVCVCVVRGPPRPPRSRRLAPQPSGASHLHPEEGGSRLFDSSEQEQHEEVFRGAARPGGLPPLVAHSTQELREGGCFRRGAGTPCTAGCPSTSATTDEGPSEQITGCQS